MHRRRARRQCGPALPRTRPGSASPRNRPRPAVLRRRPRPGGRGNKTGAAAPLGPPWPAGPRNQPGVAPLRRRPRPGGRGNKTGAAAPPGPPWPAGPGGRCGARCSRHSGGTGSRRSPNCRWLTTRRPRPPLRRLARRRPAGPRSERCASCYAGRSRPGRRWRTPKKRSAGWPVAGMACARAARPPSRPGCWPRRRRRGIARAAALAPSSPPGVRFKPGLCVRADPGGHHKPESEAQRYHSTGHGP